VAARSTKSSLNIPDAHSLKAVNTILAKLAFLGNGKGAYF
jgi:hypothetical protein